MKLTIRISFEGTAEKCLCFVSETLISIFVIFKSRFWGGDLAAGEDSKLMNLESIPSLENY